ncbi:pentapeptide repeat-containing protein [bacterium]|nr:pentapeptide repeat-containing protein [bacterium]
MKHLMTLMALVVAVTAGAQVMDTIVIGNTVNMNLNHAKLDSIIADLQAKVATLEAAQTSSFDGEYSSLNNKPTIPSNVSDLTNDAGFTTFDGAYGNLTGAPTLATVATSGSYTDLSNQLTQKDIVESAYNLSGANLTGADLSKANLSSAFLGSADLTGANLRYANLSGADLSYANLTGADLYYANLTGAVLSGTNLTGADLSGAYFSGADLFYANLTNAYLADADFTNANLTGVTWTGAYIEYCTGCTCIDNDNDNYCD